MNLLAFDTSTETLSIAVLRTQDGEAQVFAHSGAGGAQASSTLIPSAMALLAQAGLRLAELDAICFGAGPGSFTGLRTACSVAQGLAYGAAVHVLPVDSLLAIAEQARHAHGTLNAPLQVTALLDARMDEVYAARYTFDGTRWTELQGSTLLRPEGLPTQPALVAAAPGWVLAGNAFGMYPAQLEGLAAGVPRIHALPDASAMLRLAPQLLADGKAVAAKDALPSYIRDKVAKTTAERMAEKQALAAVQQAAQA
jgi:tRNA threonylcarbamoyladenosine biosynthesis protein TsaB